MPPNHVDVLIHPWSIIPCIVKAVYGSLPAHLFVTDMRLPIPCALMHADWIEPEPRFPV
jgi:1-deoxy-D-xylulose 5-phosphate reductoisomerase